MTMARMFSAAWLLFLFVSTAAALNGNVSDQSALLALKSRIFFSSSNAFLDRNWSTSSSVCSWMGVSCSNNRVVALDIHGLGLNGTIPPDFGNLTFLSSLNIRNNTFYGDLPGELAQLSSLKLLDLSSNHFSGPIPSFLSSLQELQFLYCSRNGFSGSIPPVLSNLSKLEELTLSMNFLKGSIPDEIGDLHFLTFLNLQGNQLGGAIPQSIFNLSMLQNLALSGNDLSGNLPSDMCRNLPKLEGLYLSSNELEGQIPPGLGHCLQLQLVSISRNNFNGYIPKQLGNLTLLTSLLLGGNSLEGLIPSEIGDLQRLKLLAVNGNRLLSGSIPETVFNISTLQIFTCMGNNLSGILPMSFGQWLPNLEEIYLGSNILGGSIPASISNATKLRLLDFVGNIFTGSIPKSLGDLRFLTTLYLGENKLSVESSSSELEFLTSLTKCRNLEEIVILQNPLNGALPASIGNFSTSLRLIEAANCQITGIIPTGITNLSAVSRLGLSDNDLTGFIPSTIEGLQSLQEFYLDNNSIRGSIPQGICSLLKIGAIGLRGNQLSGSVPSCIGNLTSLRNLNLASNKFSSSLPPSLWTLRNLLELDASSNSLSGHIPPEIGNLRALTVMNFSNNFLSGNIPTSIDGLQNLINVSLSNNELEGPIPDSFGKIISLETLDLSQNKLTGEIPKSLEALLYLRSFNVSLNQLSGQIPSSGPFQNFTRQSFESNDALCGAPRFQVMPCPIISPKRRNRRTLVVVYTLVGISSLLVLSTLCFVLMRWQKKKKDSLEAVLSPAVTHERTSYYELEKATNGFNETNLLGTGSYSSVYKGMLSDGTLAAIKVFNMKLSGAEKSFYTECEVLRSIRHRNLTSVITSCSNLHLDFKALVLEYMPNGSLDKWLYSHNYFLDIIQRLDIMIDVASALDYLHSGQATPVVHCDVKPRNVLLDKDMVGHICDFGISKLLADENGVSYTKTFATVGYIAPEYGLNGQVSTKCDVYSFGIMLMETFTRTSPSCDKFSGDATLRQYIKDCCPNEIMQVVDSNLLNPADVNFEAKVKCLSSVMVLALGCTETSPNARQDMQGVLSSLKKLRSELKTNDIVHSGSG